MEKKILKALEKYNLEIGDDMYRDLVQLLNAKVGSDYWLPTEGSVKESIRILKNIKRLLKWAEKNSAYCPLSLRDNLTYSYGKINVGYHLHDALYSNGTINIDRGLLHLSRMLNNIRSRSSAD